MKKYKLTKNTKTSFSLKLYQIEALINIPSINVKAGDLGGYIEKEDNLSHEGNCWIKKMLKCFVMQKCTITL